MWPTHSRVCGVTGQLERSHQGHFVCMCACACAHVCVCVFGPLERTIRCVNECHWNMSWSPVVHFRGNAKRKPGNQGNAASCYGQGLAHYRGGRKNPSSSGEVCGEVCSLLVKNVLFFLLRVTGKSSVWGTSICTSTDLFSEDPGPHPGTLDKPSPVSKGASWRV